MRPATRLLASALALLVASGLGLHGVVEARCVGKSYPIQHMAMGQPTGGGFLIPELAGNQSAPIRFWIEGHYAKAHTGPAVLQGTGAIDHTWLPSVSALCASTDGGCQGVSFPPDLFLLNQANWGNPGFVGCPDDLNLGSTRTVAELTWGVGNGSASHYGVYLIASVGFASGYDFTRVANGNGGMPNLVRSAPIPVPNASGQPRTNAQDDGYMDVTLTLSEQAKSYGDGGAGNLIKGYEILYESDQAPVSNFPDQYAQVRDPSNPAQPLAFVPHGRSSFTVAVPMPAKEVYFVTRLVYADPTRVVSEHVSGNSAPVASLRAGDEDEQEEEEPAEAEEEVAAASCCSDSSSASATSSSASAGSSSSCSSSSPTRRLATGALLPETCSDTTRVGSA